MINRTLGALAWLLNRLPRPVILAAGQVLGGFLYLGMPYRKGVAWNNLARALPGRSRRQRRSILFRSYLHFGTIFLDFLRMPRLAGPALDAVLDFNHTHIGAANRQKRGGLLVGGHLGNWEIAPPAIRQHGYPLSIVVVPQRGPGGAYLESVRRASGVAELPKSASARTMINALRAGRFLGLAGDQDARSRGIWVNFLGQPSSRHRGAATFALRTGAPMLLYTCLLQRDGRYRLNFTPISTAGLPKNQETAVQILTQRYMDALEAAILQHPEQYFWFHRMWKTAPPEGPS